MPLATLTSSQEFRTTQTRIGKFNPRKPQSDIAETRVAQDSTLTVLFQDDCGGLEFEDPNHPGSFIPATPIPSALALNIGDMLQRFSNGTFFLPL